MTTDIHYWRAATVGPWHLSQPWVTKHTHRTRVESTIEQRSQWEVCSVYQVLGDTNIQQVKSREREIG